MDQQCVQCIISGRVQGVGYRYSTVNAAKRIGVTGWVKNLPDGTVATLICGDSEQVKAMTAWLWQGPLGAKVENVESEVVLCQAFDHFESL